MNVRSRFEMHDSKVALLIRFLTGKGTLSERVKAKEFKELKAHEVELIEDKYREVLG